MQANIGISAQNRKKTAELLNVLLSDEFLLYTKTLNFHWNVKSHHFNDLHLFFKSQYEALFEICDDVAERSRSLDEPSFGTMQEFLAHTRLKEKSAAKLSDQAMVKSLLEDHEAIIRTLRVDQKVCLDKYDDAGTNNFLVDLMGKHEKMAWMLRASVVK